EDCGFLWAGPTIFPVEHDAPVPFQLAEVKSGEIFSRVTTTGSVNPVRSVTVSTQVSGTIKDLAVDVNSRVEVGQLIAKLDQDLFRAEVLQAEAKLEDALANLAKEKAGVKMQKDQIEASIAETRASYKNLEEKYKRAAELFRRDLVSKEEFDGIKAEWEMAASRFKESSARVDETKVKQANIQAAAAKVKIARAALELARVELKRSVIRAPVAGIVIAKNVEAGQTVAASLSSPPLVTIAELTKMKVDAWVDEADIGNVREGQEVQFQVDSYPDRTFNGEVVKIYPTPQVLNNVVTYDTEIHVDNEDLALKPGMTANVTIILVRKNDVLLAPHSALRIRRSDIRKVYPEIGESRRGGRKGRKGRRGGRASGRRPRDRGGVWVFREGKPERARVRYGARDAKNMEVLNGLQEGEQVIVGIRVDAFQTSQSQPRGRRATWIRRRILGGF
ncbi:MAG: efflux RND transporter periplasmic adaptor subunit, partial [Deltaproteobacteria bacterium]|nr:efflux RND transporter periplasmic adaptor subunit [Deltaproteobacteria bacterium]